MKTFEEETIIEVIDKLGKMFHDNAVAHGFWPFSDIAIIAQEKEYTSENIDVNKRNKGEMIALMHSELSEMLEAVRHPTIFDGKHEVPKMDEHCPDFTSEEVEAADTIIRLLEYCIAYKLRIGEAILAKHQYNVSRPFKHNKKF